MTKSRKQRVYNFPYLLLTLAVFFWSGNFIVGRAARADVPPVALAFWRWIIASLLVSCLAVPHLKSDWRAVKGKWGILLMLSALGVSSFNTLLYLGLQYTIAINGFLMQAIMPVLIMTISFLIFREKITVTQTAGIAFSMAGALIIIVQGNFNVFSEMKVNRGDLFIFLAVVSYAVYSVMLRKRPSVHPLSFVAMTFMFGSLILLPFYLWEAIFIRSISFNASTFLAVSYVAVFPSIVSYLCFNRGVELIGANRAGLFLYLMPVFGSIMAMIFLGESFRWFHGVGMLLIALGIFLSTRESM